VSRSELADETINLIIYAVDFGLVRLIYACDLANSRRLTRKLLCRFSHNVVSRQNRRFLGQAHMLDLSLIHARQY
jgi:hypothetical protein